MNLRDFLATRAAQAKSKPTATNNEELAWMEAAEGALNANAVKPAAPIPRPKGPMIGTDAPDLL